MFSIMTLCVPHRSIAPLMHRLELEHFGTPSEDAAAAAAVRAAVKGVEVELRAEVAAVDLTLEEVLELTPGDVLWLERAVEKGVTLFAAEVPAYSADAGRNGSARAVQVRERCRRHP